MSWGTDLQAEHERYLTEKHVNGPLILTDYPSTIKPFYMRVSDDGKTVAAMDVLVPGVGEIIGGSQREERLDVLQSRMSRSRHWTSKIIGGTSICESSAPFRMPALAWGLSGLCNMQPAWPTSAT